VSSAAAAAVATAAATAAAQHWGAERHKATFSDQQKRKRVLSVFTNASYTCASSTTPCAKSCMQCEYEEKYLKI
jgi:outer membrane protease